MLRAKHPRALPLAAAAEAAGLQGRFFEMCDSLYGDTGHIDDPHLWQRAERLGLDLDRFERDRRSEEVSERIREQVRTAIRGGLMSTPTLLIDGVVQDAVTAAAPEGRLP